MKKLIIPLFFMAMAIVLSLAAPAARSQEGTPLFGGLVFEVVPPAPTDLAVSAFSDNFISLSWRDNSPLETSTEVWRAVFSSDLHLWAVLPENTSSFVDADLEDNTAYSYRVRACNSDGCSDFSNMVTVTTRDDDDDDSSVFISCFVATAVYGDPFHPDVQALRNFRDEYLMNCAPGRAFVAAYYRHSPPLAAFIAKHETLRVVLRAAFVPVAAAAKHPLASLFAVAGLIVCTAARTVRKRSRRSKENNQM